jgi:hypothetical protein
VTRLALRSRYGNIMMPHVIVSLGGPIWGNAMNKNELKIVMDREPLLTDVGFWPHSDLRNIPRVTPESFVQSRESLLKDLEGCQLVCDWLRQVQPIKSINCGTYRAMVGDPLRKKTSST